MLFFVIFSASLGIIPGQMIKGYDAKEDPDPNK